MRFTDVLKPGMWAVRQLRFGTKLTLLFMVAALPLLTVVAQLVGRNMQDLSTARAELEGVRWVSEASVVVRSLQAHRGLTNMLLLGGSDLQARRDQARSALDKNVQALDASLRGAGPLAPANWAGIRDRLGGFYALLEGKPAPQAFELHNALIEDLNRLIYELAERSQLLYDPDPLTYLLMDMSVSRVVPWRDQVGLVRGAGTELLSTSVLDESDVTRVKTMQSELALRSRGIVHAQALLAEKGFRPPAYEAALQSVQQFMALTLERFKPGAASGDAMNYYQSAQAVTAALDTYQDVVNQAMLDELDARIADLRSRSLWLGGVTVLITATLLYLMLAFRVSFLADLRQVLRFMENTANGNLQHQARIRGKDELSDMSRAMAVLVHNVSSMVATVRSNAALLSHSGDVLTHGNQALSERTEQQAANLEQTSASVQELAATVQVNAHVAQQSDAAAQRVRSTAEDGAAGMREAVASIEGIEASTRRMDEIVGVIDALAFQTNILALNAAVEAARAGESGRGFAVVATEVRSLAQRSAASAKEIRQLITNSSNQVSVGVSQIRTAGERITGIVAGVRDVATHMSQISVSSTEQSASLSEITTAIHQLDELTQRNGAMVEQAVQQANELQNRARLLTESVSVFKLPQGTADEAQRLVDQALALRSRAGRREAFLQALNAPDSGLFDRDMYVFALERSGRYAAFAGNPARVGARVQDVAGPTGEALLQAIIQQADSGPGWVEYDIANPLTGKSQAKMSYVTKVDDLYVGCGVYKSTLEQV